MENGKPHSWFTRADARVKTAESWLSLGKFLWDNWPMAVGLLAYAGVAAKAILSIFEPVAALGWVGWFLSFVVGLFLACITTVSIFGSWYLVIVTNERRYGKVAAIKSGVESRMDDRSPERIDSLGAMISKIGKSLDDYKELSESINAKQHTSVLAEIRELKAKCESIERRVDEKGYALYKQARAIRIEAKYAQILPQINRISLLLERGRLAPEGYDWNLWVIRYGKLQKNLRRCAALFAPYGDVERRIFEIPASHYKGNRWIIAEERFPSSDLVHDFKTFRMLMENFQNVMGDVTAEMNTDAGREIEFRSKGIR